MGHGIIQDAVPEDNEALSAINVTPLIDVMFCLLIIFMVATPMMGAKTAESIELPAARGETITEEQFLYGYIVVDRTGKVFLGTLPLSESPAQWKEQLKANVKLKDDGMVFIQGDQNAEHGRIVDVLVALKAAGISSVGFVTDPHGKRREDP